MNKNHQTNLILFWWNDFRLKFTFFDVILFKAQRSRQVSIYISLHTQPFRWYKFCANYLLALYYTIIYLKLCAFHFITPCPLFVPGCPCFVPVTVCLGLAFIGPSLSLFRPCLSLFEQISLREDTWGKPCFMHNH